MGTPLLWSRGTDRWTGGARPGPINHRSSPGCSTLTPAIGRSRSRTNVRPAAAPAAELGGGVKDGNGSTTFSAGSSDEGRRRRHLGSPAWPWTAAWSSSPPPPLTVSGWRRKGRGMPSAVTPARPATAKASGPRVSERPDSGIHSPSDAGAPRRRRHHDQDGATSGLTVGAMGYRCSGFSKSYRHPASHAERWLPCAGSPPTSLRMRARCRRFQVMNVTLRFVKSFSGPPESASR